MQGLADGYFVLPSTLAGYLASTKQANVGLDHPEVKGAVAEVEGRMKKLLSIKGKRSPDSFHKELGHIIWNDCGMARNADGLKKAIKRIPEIRAEFWENVSVLGDGNELNQSLEKAGRVADFLELGELMCRDALARDESCGCHYRTEHTTDEGEAQRNDEDYKYVAAWEWNGPNKEQTLHKEDLSFEFVKPSARSYK